jgi:tetratricopeptide (TPR) repeat protein/tRNA A-37 threonylcarbamoyl transferase component Bud32
MSHDHDHDSDADDAIPEEVDEGLAFAYGGDPGERTSPGVIDRIGEIAGSKPQVLLHDESGSETPMLKPVGPKARACAGKYVVHGELGRGGVGSVHRGHDQDLGRDVAMKFLHEKYKDHPDVLHRFVEEAQIGGQLQHPGIVPVYDIGLADGRPFFAMKLVKGQTLAKRLAERESPESERREFLAIFEDVCQTLAYAHARGVVHRDLKPANIMIGNFGEVQVVDWGMGKVLASGGVADERLAAERRAEQSAIETVRSRGHGSQSIVGSVMGTPAYMPPEQARGDVEQMDERGDVFALGAILCEILTGAPPYVGRPEELISMAALGELDDAHARLTTCGGEPKMIELALHCLMPKPAARPRSAEVVAKAVHDHLAAVEARVHEARVEAAEAKVRAAALKRTQTLGLGLIGAIAGGLAVSLWFWRAAENAATNEAVARAEAVVSADEARANEGLALERTALAERELARAVEIKRLITEMLQSIDPDVARTADTALLAGILDTASERLANGAIEDELVAAELHYVTGQVYHSIAEYSDAEQHLLAASELMAHGSGEEHPNTLASLHALALLRLDQGHWDEAESLFQRTLEVRRRVLGDEHPDTLASMTGLGLCYRSQGRYAEAEPLELRTLEIKRRTLGTEHPSTLNSLNNLAGLYFVQGRYAEAEPLFLRMLETREHVLGEEHPDTLQSAGNLAVLHREQGDEAEAETLYRETHESELLVLGEEHPQTLATMRNLATLLMEQGRYGETEPLFVQSLTIQGRVLGEEHQDTLSSMNSLASLYRAQGRYDEAEPIRLRALEISRRVLGEEHPDTLSGMTNLANLYASQGRQAEAEALHLETLATKRRVLGEDHPRTLSSMGQLADLYARQGRHAEAEPLYLRTLESRERVLGEEHADTLGTMANLAVNYTNQGRYAEAEALQLRTLGILRRVLGEEHPNTLGTLTNLGLLQNSMERYAEAALTLETSLTIKRRVLGLEHPWTRLALNGLATAYAGLGRVDDALALQRELLEWQVAPAEEADARAGSLNRAAWTLLTHEVEPLRDPERARLLAERACALAEGSNADALWGYLDTLTLAQHLSGDGAAAIETQKRAIALKPGPADPEMTARLAEYEAEMQQH